MSTLLSFIAQKDLTCFYFLNRRLHCTALTMFMRAITQFGSLSFSVGISLFFLVYNRKTGIFLALNLISGQILIQSLKRMVNRPRPYKTLDWVIARKPPRCTYSFPSGHSCSALSIALSVSAFFPSLKAVLLCLALLVGISRACLGFHYPTDVTMGFLIAFLVFEAIEMTI
ncbi:MAG TPA: phosphatase PAP2 family protein [Clostridia bacterium]|nr:phosphatase PAP2 family protein [Clostridia bacterium]